MKGHSIKTDNFNLQDKVKLRQMAVQHLDEIKVLDLFAGNNCIWSNFDCKRYYGIEIEKGKGKNLNADNRKVIPSLDLSDFNVIDCDSYGMPVEQLSAIFKNPTLKDGTVIIYTAISSKLSSLSAQILKYYGIQNMYKKSKVMFNKFSHDYFYGFMYDKGIRTVTEYEKINNSFTKKYGYFVYKCDKI